MKPKRYIILFAIVLSAIVLLSGIFYWHNYQFKAPGSPETSGGISGPSQSTENEIATSTPPFVVKGEISRGNPAKKQIIFTFDAGAGINSLQKILEVAQAHNLKVAFFSTGKFAQKYPELIKEISAQGHEIFNHTYSHPHLTQITDDEIKEELSEADQIISSLTGKTTKPYFRPPYGDRDSHVLQVAGEAGYQSVYWTTDALDWMTDRTEEQTKERIYSNLKPGAIILMHIGDNITGNILNEVFTKIENDGYKIVSLTEGLK